MSDATAMINVLYLKGSGPDVDSGLTEQLTSGPLPLTITTVGNPADALVELRRGGDWQALLVSPGLSPNETLALIASLRRDRVPIAIVPVVDESHQDIFGAAVSAGADDVLVKRGATLVNLNETLARIQQSPHLFPSESRRRLQVLYAGRDPLVWNLIEQVPFVKAERVTCGIDGACPVRAHGAADGSLRCEVVVIDEQPGDAHPLQVLKSVKAQASDLPVVMLTSSGAGDIATAALELGADDTVTKAGIFRRRLIATLRRVHQRIELQTQHTETKGREERLRQIVENVPAAIAVVGADGAVMALNAAGLHLFGATKPRDVVGRDFRTLMTEGDRAAATQMLHLVLKGETASLRFGAETLSGTPLAMLAHAVLLERDARGGRGMIVHFSPAPADASSEPTSGAGSPAVDESARAGLAQLDEERAAFEQQREADRNERQSLATRLAQAEAALGQVDILRSDLAASQAALKAAEARLAEERSAVRANDQALAAATAQLVSGQAHAEEQRRAVEQELQLLRDVLATERRDREQERVALERQFADEADAHVRVRHEWEAARQQNVEVDRERLAAVERERQQLAESLAALEAEHRDLRLALTHEREAREREARELDVLRASLEQEDALRADMDARRAQATRESAAHAQAREAELVERCQILEAQVAQAERRAADAAVAAREAADQAHAARQQAIDADQRAEFSLRTALESTAREAGQPVDAGLEDVGALTTAMMPMLEGLMGSLVEHGRQLTSRGTATESRHDMAPYAEALTQAWVLVRQLAAFGRRQADASAAVDLNDAIAQAEPMLAQLVGPYVGFEVRLGPTVALRTPHSDLDQLLTSLVTFGRDVLPAGGSIVLETSTPPAGAGEGLAARVTLTAMGYGTRFPVEAPAIVLVARRCGARVSLDGEEGWKLRLAVDFGEAPSASRSRPWQDTSANGPAPAEPAARATRLD